MDLWILYNSSFDKAIETPATRMLNEAKRNGIEAELLFYPYFNIGDNILYYKGKRVDSLPKCCFLRGQDYPLMEYLEHLGVRTINSSYTIKTALDKWKTHKLVGELNIEQIKTLELKDYSFSEVVAFLGLPFILKYKYGCQGKGVYLIHSKHEFNEILKNITRDDFIIQEFISESWGKDVRVYVIGDKCIGAVERINSNGFMSNLAQGGKAYSYDMTSTLEFKSQRIRKALKGDIISVDFVISKRGLLFCEANTNAGFASFNYLNYPVREEFMSYIKKVIG